MRIRPYIESRDYEALEKWIDSSRTHALWCANLLPCPLTQSGLRHLLEESGTDGEESAYVATEDDGEAVGFFCYSVNVENNTGFFRFVIVDAGRRGLGYGKKMMQTALRYAFEITDVEAVRLNVFAENSRAISCYEQCGFQVQSVVEKAFAYGDEWWGRCSMMAERQNWQG